jgi:ATP-dependent protease HslVU (ClpYQ) peptidase subunit
MDATKSGETSADDAKVKSDLFNLVEKLQIELQAKNQELQRKDQELADKNQENQVCNIFYLLFLHE